jgi:hypothetical protein
LWWCYRRQVITVCQAVNRNLRILRARFSALIPRELQRAMQQLVAPNAADAAAVDARQEIDLRIGASFTRFQTLLLQVLQLLSLIGGPAAACEFLSAFLPLKQHQQQQQQHCTPACKGVAIMNLAYEVATCFSFAVIATMRVLSDVIALRCLQDKFDWAGGGVEAERLILSYGPCQFPTLGIIVQRAW